MAPPPAAPSTPPLVLLTRALWRDNALPGEPLPPEFALGVYDALAAVLAMPEPVMALFRAYLRGKGASDEAIVRDEMREWLTAYFDGVAEAVPA